uniref:Uncharacterized protein n=1 Tax=Onchocerca volvulus TaxID=6282 RepID=A0A8R1TNT2_ONCVO
MIIIVYFYNDTHTYTEFVTEEWFSRTLLPVEQNDAYIKEQ